MTISRRSFLAVGATLLILFGIIHAIASRIMLAGFTRVETTLSERNAERGQQAIEDVVDQLAAKLSDWANWDDTYAFVEERGEEYVRSNLSAQSLANLDLRFILYLDLEGRLVHGAGFSNEGSEGSAASELPDGLIELIVARQAVFNTIAEDSVRSGLLSLPEGVFAVAGRPIQTSRATGPVRGTIVFGLRIDEADLASLAERLRFRLSLIRLDDVVDPAGLDRLARLQKANRPISSIIDEDSITGSALVADIEGRLAYVVEVTTPRFVRAQANATSDLLLLILAVAGSGAVGATLLVLRLVVLRRLAALHRAVGTISASGALDRRVSVEGSDELADFAQTVNHLLDRVMHTSDELTAAKISAESANRAKSEFLANMSHEVRTPMTAILGYADLLAEQAAAPDFQPMDCVETIRRNAKHLLTIINDVLDLSKIEAGRMLIERMPCSPGAIANEVVELLRENADRKGLRLAIDFATPIPSVILSDPTRLRQILLNLAGNAIKFTLQGSVTLRYSCDPGAGALTIDVEDTGIGIPRHQQVRLFTPFNQADSSTSRHFGGTGLGLAISRRLAQLLGGDLELSASGETGSTFRLRIATGPLQGVAMAARPQASPRAAVDTTASASGPLKGLRFLLAEDGPDNQRLIRFVLRRAGAEVDLAADGASAVDAVTKAMAARQAYDLILLDMQMPVLDGYGAARDLRARGVRTPILALTAHAMEGDRVACLAAGCDEYESKPIDRAKLIATCARLAGNRGQRTAA